MSNISVQPVLNGAVLCSQLGVGTVNPQACVDIGGFGTMITGALGKVLIADNYNGYTGVQAMNKSNASNAGFGFRVTDDTKTPVLGFHMPSSGNTGTYFGATRSTQAEVYTNGPRNLAVGTVSTQDFLFGTNNTERMRIVSGGSVGIGVSARTAVLQLKAGTATAGTAPLKLTTTGAALLTTPEAGALETDAPHLYWTDSSGTRHTLV